MRHNLQVDRVMNLMRKLEIGTGQVHLIRSLQTSVKLGLHLKGFLMKGSWQSLPRIDAAEVSQKSSEGFPRQDKLR